LIKYCEIDGAFVFYSEEDFQGEIKYAGVQEFKYIDDLRPADQTVTKVASIRLMGNQRNWGEETLTLIEEENFRGTNLQMLDEWNNETVGLHFAPKSAVVTGECFWTVYDENGGCRNIRPEKFGDFHSLPMFYRNLRDEINFYTDIKDAKIGCHCNDPQAVKCPDNSQGCNYRIL